MQIQVGKYALTPAKLIAGTVGSYGFEQMQLLFDPFWEPLAKKIVFETEDGTHISLLVEEEQEIVVPPEVCRSAGVCRFAVVGYEEEKVIITLAGELLVLPTISPEGDPPEEVTPSITTQILDRLDRIGRECNQLWQALYRLREEVFVAANEKNPSIRGIPRVEERRIRKTAAEQQRPAPSD